MPFCEAQRAQNPAVGNHHASTPAKEGAIDLKGSSTCSESLVYVKPVTYIFGVGYDAPPCVNVFMVGRPRPGVCSTVKFCLPRDVMCRILSYFNECGPIWHPKNYMCEFICFSRNRVSVPEMSETWFSRRDTHAVWALLASCMTSSDRQRLLGVRGPPLMGPTDGSEELQGLTSSVRSMALNGSHGSWTRDDDHPVIRRPRRSAMQNSGANRRGGGGKGYTGPTPHPRAAKPVATRELVVYQPPTDPGRGDVSPVPVNNGNDDLIELGSKWLYLKSFDPLGVVRGVVSINIPTGDDHAIMLSAGFYSRKLIGDVDLTMYYDLLRHFQSIRVETNDRLVNSIIWRMNSELTKMGVDPSSDSYEFYSPVPLLVFQELLRQDVRKRDCGATMSSLGVDHLNSRAPTLGALVFSGFTLRNIVRFGQYSLITVCLYQSIRHRVELSRWVNFGSCLLRMYIEVMGVTTALSLDQLSRTLGLSGMFHLKL